MLIYVYNVSDMTFSNVFLITFSNGSGMTFSNVSRMTFSNASGMTFSNVYGMTFSNVFRWNASGLTFSNVSGMTWFYVTKLYYGVTSSEESSPVDDLIKIGITQVLDTYMKRILNYKHVSTWLTHIIFLLNLFQNSVDS